MDTYETAALRAATKRARHPEPLSPAEWDRRYPGVLDSVGILGGAANVIMQLAHPAVGHGVVESRVESGHLFGHPVKRARTTITYLAVATLGTAEEKRDYAKAVSKQHAQVYSTAESRVQYRALDPNLQLWVAACLYWGFADTLRRFYGELDEASADSLYRELETLGTTLQVRPEMWPRDRAAFEAYFAKGIAELSIDDAVRSYLTAITDMKFLHPILRRVFGPVNRFFTAGFLPPRVREQMRFEWGPAQEARFDRVVRVLAFVNRALPRLVRQGPFLLVMADFRIRRRLGAPLV